MVVYCFLHGADVFCFGLHAWLFSNGKLSPLFSFLPEGIWRHSNKLPAESLGGAQPASMSKPVTNQQVLCEQVEKINKGYS